MNLTEKEDLKQAVDILIEHLNKDKSEGSYYYSWQANIAMSIYDVFKDANFEYDSIHELANKSAKKFLDILTYQQNDND